MKQWYARLGPLIALSSSQKGQLLYVMQVAVKRLDTSSAPPEAEATFLEEIHTLQLASASCQRACRMLGCCKLNGDACIVMSLYPKSAAKRLEESQSCPSWLSAIIMV